MIEAIGLDLDGVVVYSAQTTIKWLKRMGKLSKNITTSDINWYNIEWNPEKQTGFPTVTMDDLHTIFMCPDFWEATIPYKYVQTWVEALHKKYEIHILTDRRWYPELEQQTRDWLYRYNIPFDRLTCIAGKKKFEYARDHGLKYVIEDSPYNVISIAPETKKTFLLKRCWNDPQVNGVVLPLNCERVTWRKIGDELLNDQLVIV